MARVKVNGSYENGNYKLVDSNNGGVIRTIEPESVVTIGQGRTAVHAFARCLKDSDRLTLVPLNLGEHTLKTEQLKSRCGRRKGFILLPNFEGMLAQNPGAARRGILHPMPKPSNCPLVNLFRTHLHMRTDFIRKVDQIDQVRVDGGGNFDPHHGGLKAYSATDGQVTPTGKQDGCSGLNVSFVSGGTFAVDAVTTVPAKGFPRYYVSVHVTPEADLEQVAAAVSNVHGTMMLDIHDFEQKTGRDLSSRPDASA